jgi:hypothetical protein
MPREYAMADIPGWVINKKTSRWCSMEKNSTGANLREVDTASKQNPRTINVAGKTQIHRPTTTEAGNIRRIAIAKTQLRIQLGAAAYR